MNKRTKTILVSIPVILVAFITPLLCHYFITNTWTDLDKFIQRKMNNGHYVGMAIGLIEDGQLTWEGYYGYADLENEIPVTNETLFMVASVSKPVTSTAVMRLVDEGLLDLDEDLDTFFPFSIRNPNHPSMPITARMLLTHTSSIIDNWDVLDSTYTLPAGGDSPWSLGDFLNETFSPNGQFYFPEINFLEHAPGETNYYSNTGFGLLGYLVEVIKGIPFNVYCKDNIFTPLNMDATGWFISEINESLLTYNYEYSKGDYIKYNHYGFPTYPDGSLKTNILDYSMFIQMYMNRGILGTERILNETTVDEVLTVQYPEIDEGQALGWYYTERSANIKPFYPSHSGGDVGISTLALFDPDSKCGFILFSNFGARTFFQDKPFWFDIYRRLLWELNLEY